MRAIKSNGGPQIRENESASPDAEIDKPARTAAGTRA
jgi:hypothetical protein